MEVQDAIEECAKQNPYNMCTKTLVEEKNLIPLIVGRLNQLGIYDIGSTTAGNRSLVLRDAVNAQVIKRASTPDDRAARRSSAACRSARPTFPA